MLSGGNSCAEHKGQGRGSAQGKVSGTPESREFQTAGISDPSQRGCSGEGHRRPREALSAKSRSTRVGLVLSQHLWGTGKHRDRGAVQLCC